MAASEGFIEFLRDALVPLGPVQVRRMFGGAGVYADGVMFGLVADDTLYLKADVETRRNFEEEGAGPFLYSSRGKTISLSYWRLPERLLDDPEEMTAWARKALAAARRAAAGPRAARVHKAARKGRSGG